MLLLALSKTSWILIICGVLIAHFVLSVTALYLLFKDRGISAGIIVWNLVIAFGVVIGPCAYIVVRKAAKRS